MGLRNEEMDRQPGPNMLWLWNLTALCELLAGDPFEVDWTLPEWLTEGQTALILIDPQKGRL